MTNPERADGRDDADRSGGAPLELERAVAALAGAEAGEDRRDHPVRRAVADAGGDEQHHEAREKIGRLFCCTPTTATTPAAAMTRKLTTVTTAPPRRSERRPPSGREIEPTGAEEAVGQGDVRALEDHLEQGREGRRVADERAEGADVEQRHEHVCRWRVARAVGPGSALASRRLSMRRYASTAETTANGT